MIFYIYQINIYTDKSNKKFNEKINKKLTKLDMEGIFE
jgi:hypothetical protein